jgi:hypothetical protein
LSEVSDRVHQRSPGTRVDDSDHAPQQARSFASGCVGWFLDFFLLSVVGVDVKVVVFV